MDVIGTALGGEMVTTTVEGRERFGVTVRYPRELRSHPEQIAREVRAFRDRTGRPVFAHIQGLGCSGAYYLAAGCDEIRIQPAGITGSIGVIAILPHYRKLADKVRLAADRLEGLLDKLPEA